MTRSPSGTWKPTVLDSVDDGPFDTSMGTAKVKTDATFGYLKALGNRQGPHALACEWVGTSLAKWFGLSVPDFAILTLETVDCYDLPGGAKTLPGPAFISRYVPGHTWGRSAEELHRLENLTDITRLVVFDHWVRNCDRHPPNLEKRKPNYSNVYLGDTDNPEKLWLFAIDHSHCFDCGRDLTPRMSEIGNVRDEGTYGLFPEFGSFIQVDEVERCKSKLRSVETGEISDIVNHIPKEWEVNEETRSALVDFILDRARFLADRIDAGCANDWRQLSE